ncbi:MAG: TlpA family protein disulfide reductase [Deltaproteobacteria bacterium]|nr:TlpA family protein disulfide reductase [Deltaproteobacteria bacterium]
MRKLIKISTALILVGLLIGNGITANAEQNVRNIWEKSIEKPAPDFVLKDVEGKQMRLSDYKGKVVLLEFTTTWCPYCRKIMPYLEKIHDRYNKKDFVLISVYVQESQKKVKSYADKHKIPYKVLLDENGKVAESYSVVGVPELILVNRDGRILCRQCRSVDMMLEEMF